jgi:hypothetical protein
MVCAILQATLSYVYDTPLGQHSILQRNIWKSMDAVNVQYGICR